MLRAAVVLALVAVALAQSSPFTRGSTAPFPNFANAGSQVRFVPRAGRVLAVNAPNANSLQVNSASAFRVVSVGSNSGGLNTETFTPNDYFGNAGRERFQNINGAGLAAQGHLVLSLDPTARDRVIRDTRLRTTTRQSVTSNFLAVPTFTRKIRSLPLNANDIVLATTATTVPLMLPTGYNSNSMVMGATGISMNSPSSVRYFIVNQEDVAGIYTSGLRLGGDSYAANLAGSLFGGVSNTGTGSSFGAGAASAAASSSGASLASGGSRRPL